MTQKTLPLNDALKATLDAARLIGTESVSLADGLNRVLAADVFADADMPPFRKSMMDGYACRQDDLHLPLKIVGEVAAGEMPAVAIGPNECVRIMTGAPVPEGADVVVMVEHTTMIDERTVAVTESDAADHISPKGRDIRSGDRVLFKGTVLRPAHLAVLATVGAADFLVSRRPLVGVIATGDELVAPECAIQGAMIRNSNSFQVVAQLSQMAIPAKYYGIVPDDFEQLRHTVGAAKDECDLVIISGGVSMGKYDHVPDVLRALGFDFAYTRVRMQPGKPTVFGVSDGNKYCFGMPGNPVSALVVFELFIKPFLFRLMGHDFSPRVVTATLDASVSRKKSDRPLWIPVRFSAPSEVAPITYHGSAHINAYCDADGMVMMPSGEHRLEKGVAVHVQCL